MPGINRCYVCEGRFARGEERSRCEACGHEFHGECRAALDTDCPRCDGEAWVGAAEF